MTDFLPNIPAPTRVAANDSIATADLSLASYALVSSSVTGNRRGFRTGPVAPQQLKTLESSLPPYGSRKGWIPRSADDFGDGGAFPEILVAQFPMDMGRGAGRHETTVALQTDADGKLSYDAVIKQGLASRLAVHTRPDAMKAKWSAKGELQKPDEEDIEEIENRTKAALDAVLAKKLSRGVVKSVNQEPEYIKYTPNEQAPGHNANCSQRIIRMVEAQVDPMEPPKFRHKRAPRGPPSPPPAVLHSPTRKLSAKDQAAWKIPPCVSNWKNQKGYTIPLDKRLLADGRNLQDMSVSDKFASLSESLYIAERSAREEIRIRNDLLKQKKQQEEGAREDQLRQLAAVARTERAAILKLQREEAEKAPDADTEEQERRKDVERQRKREIERDLRLERAGKKGKRAGREEERDISEKIALGQAKPTTQESMFDSRLFNQSAGMDTGYNAGDDEKYNLYDKPLFADRSREGVYRFDKDRMEQSVGSMSAVPAFAGASSSQLPRTTPVTFEADTEDPFGLASLIDSAVKPSK